MNNANATDRELWHVQLPSGEVRCWSLDALDVAFQAGEIGPKTYVRRLGDMEWERLDVLLGLEESELSSAPEPGALRSPPPLSRIPRATRGGRSASVLSSPRSRMSTRIASPPR